MKHAILMLILSSSITITMDFDKLTLLRQTKSTSDIHDMQAAPDDTTVPDDDSLQVQPSDDDHDYDSLSTQTSSEEDDEDNNNDELAQLAANTDDPHANPHTTLRGLPFPFGTQSHSHRKKGKARAASAHRAHGRKHTAVFGGGAAGVETREATYDDVVRQIQSSSRLALSEARTLNRQYLKAVLDQLQDGITSAQNTMAQDAQQAIAIMHDLQQRLVSIEKLLPEIKQLLEQDALLAQRYEQTLQSLITTLKSYTQDAQANQTEQDQKIQTIHEHMRTTAQIVRDIRSQTTQILATTREIHGNERISSFKQTCARYTATAATGGILALLVAWYLTTDHAPEAMEIKDSLQAAL